MNFLSHFSFGVIRKPRQLLLTPLLWVQKGFAKPANAQMDFIVYDSFFATIHQIFLMRKCTEFPLNLSKLADAKLIGRSIFGLYFAVRRTVRSEKEYKWSERRERYEKKTVKCERTFDENRMFAFRASKRVNKLRFVYRLTYAVNVLLTHILRLIHLRA